MNLKKIKKLFRLNIYLCYSNIILLKILRFIFKFNSWHSNAPFICRAYKKKLVDEINNLDTDKNGTTIEIGGGLGDVISRIAIKNKILIDLDKNLKIPILLLHPNVKFICGSFEEVKKIKLEKIGVLILVNWIHELEKNKILENIYKINSVKKIEYLILDEINDNMYGYKYKHRFTNIDGFITKKVFEDPEKIRKFRILKCKDT